jgi:hypothetical protein
MIHIILIVWFMLSIPVAFVLRCLCWVSGQCARDEEKRGEQ